MRKTRDALDDRSENTKQGEPNQDISRILPAQKFKPPQARARGVGGEDEVEEAGSEPVDAEHAGAQLGLGVAGDDARAGRARGQVEGVGRDPGRVQLAGGAGGGHGGGAPARPAAAAHGHAHHHVVDHAVPHAPVHGHRPLPGVGHLTQARPARALRRRRQAADRPPFRSHVSSMLPFDK